MNFDLLGYLSNLFSSQPPAQQKAEDDALIQQHKQQQEAESKERFWRQFNPVLRAREGDTSWSDESKSWIQKDPEEEKFKNIKSLVN